MEKGEVDGYLLKPMNCPMHIKIFSSEQRSYRDMPVGLAEFGTVYRWEKSGELGGMTRVPRLHPGRCAPVLHRRAGAGRSAGLSRAREDRARHPRAWTTTASASACAIRTATSTSATPAQWDRAEAACINAAESLGVTFTKEPGEAAFYGPKIDFVVKDVIGREWQLGTVQVGLPAPPALRPVVRRRRQQASQPGDDPPRAVRLDGTVHRRALPSTSPARSRCGSPRCRWRCCRSARSTST
jgi:threonyl-tRNA synthetase